MATFTSNFINGVATTPGRGPGYRLVVSPNWAVGDYWTVSYSASRGSFDIGVALDSEGDPAWASAMVPSFAITVNNRLYIASGNVLNLSGIKSPSGFNIQDTGASYIPMADRFSSPEPIVALSSYQGRLAVFARNSTQIWSINADPDLFVQNQILQNFGTFAPLSVQAVGDLDVLLLSDSGVRSLRVRDSSLNAIVMDVGSPIDLEVQDLILDPTVDKTRACATVEPTSNRYWLAINHSIYVLSYFPTAKITAWSNYVPTYQDDDGNDLRFQPEKFVVYNGHVWCRDTVGRIIVYSDQYDTTIVRAELPWLAGKTPALRKQAKAVDIACDGSWQVYASMNYRETDLAKMRQIVPETEIGTFQDGTYPLGGVGTHVKLIAQSLPKPTAATLAKLVFHYEEGNTR